MTAYESSYVSWYLKSNCKKLMVGFGILFVLLLLPSFMVETKIDQAGSADLMQFPLVYQLGIVTGVCGLFSLMMPILQFQHFMKKRSCDLYLPLPIKRNRFFVIQFVIGLCYILAPIVMFFAIAACERNSWDFISYYAFYFLCIGSFLCALYALITYFVVHCNSFWDALCSTLGFAFVSVFMFLTINELLSNVVMQSSTGAYDAEEFFPIEMIGGLLSPILASGMLLLVLMEGFYSYQLDVTQTIWDALLAQEVSWSMLIVYWLIVFVVMSLLAYRTYYHRAGEQSEQRTIAKVVYPLLIFLVTSSLLFQNFFDLGMLWITVVVFFVLNFIAERRIVVHKHMIASFVIMALLTSGITYTLIETEVFHTIYEVPDQDAIVSTSIRMYFNDENTAPIHDNQKIQSFMSKEVKQETVNSSIIALHEDLVETYSLENSDYGIYSIDFTYMLDNGKYINRYYALDYKKYKDEIDYLIAQLYNEEQVDLIATSYFVK